MRLLNFFWVCMLVPAFAWAALPTAHSAILPHTARLPVSLAAKDIQAVLLELPPTVAPSEKQESEDVIGYCLPAPANVRPSLATTPWREIADGSHVVRLELHSAGATGLRVELTDLGQLELRVYDPATLSAYGPYTYPRLSDENTWWSTIIFGERIGLEFRSPPGVAVPSSLPQIKSVGYRYGSPQDDYPPLGSCDPDMMCNPDVVGTPQDLAVGHMEYRGTDGLLHNCTGAMLARLPSDEAPIFMTAKHCVEYQSVASTLVVFWNYQTAACNGPDPGLNGLPRNDGALLLKTDGPTDWTILGFYDPAQSDYRVGWTGPNYIEDGTSVYAVHHPKGSFKRLSLGTKTENTTCGTVGGDYEYGVSWGIGRTLPGSSGCPLYNQVGDVCGTLSCGRHQCPPDDDAYSLFGRMDMAFYMIGWYLAPASPTYVNGGVAGDPGNRGITERGTPGYPLNTVLEGTLCVPTGGDVYIAPGTYNEQLRLWRPMTLRRDGTSGVATIGRP